MPIPATKNKRRPYTPRMPRDQRREQLLDAALEVIARDGYTGVSIDSISREAGVTRPVVYGVFDDLQDLLYALLDRQEERALGQLMEALPADLGEARPEEFLLTAIRRMAVAVAGDPMTWRPILAQPDTTPLAVRERVNRDREVIRGRIEDLLRAGLGARGEEVDLEIASHALFGIAEHFGRILVEEPGRFPPERMVGAARQLLANLT